MNTYEKYLTEGSKKVGDTYVYDKGLTGHLSDANFKYFEMIIKSYLRGGGKLETADDVFKLRDAWVYNMKQITDPKHHHMITKNWS